MMHVSRVHAPLTEWLLLLLTVFLETDASYMGYASARRHCMSKAAVTHTFRKLKTPSRCRECDSYVYFQGAECVEVTSANSSIERNSLSDSRLSCSAVSAVTRSVSRASPSSAATSVCRAK